MNLLPGTEDLESAAPSFAPRLARLAPLLAGAAVLAGLGWALRPGRLLDALPNPSAATLWPAALAPAVILLLPARLWARFVRTAVPVAMLVCIVVNIRDFPRLNRAVFCPLAIRNRHDLVSLADNPRTWRELGQYHMYGLIRRYARGRRIVTHDKTLLSRWYLTTFAGVWAYEVREYAHALTADQAEALKRLEHHRLQHPQVSQDVHYLIVPAATPAGTCDFRVYSLGREHFLLPEGMLPPEPVSTRSD